MSKQKLGGDKSKRRVAMSIEDALLMGNTMPFYSTGAMEQAMAREHRAIQKLIKTEEPKEMTQADLTRIEAAKEKRKRKAKQHLKNIT